MPAPEVAPVHTHTETAKTLGHVDTLIANATIDDLAAAFTAAARSRLRQTSARRIATTNELDNALARARSLYGAGMGFASLGILSSIVKATRMAQWADVLAVIDADISQAMQSCKEELEGGRVSDTAVPQEAIGNLCARDVEIWGGEFPFDRASNSIECWKF
ncbi:hypothetical protein F4604DRAFT_1853211 [Suillus subluteus]|nr:hypothetical protein F4604DRAFT_1853211 [Suillus subluteus]